MYVCMSVSSINSNLSKRGRSSVEGWKPPVLPPGATLRNKFGE